MKTPTLYDLYVQLEHGDIFFGGYKFFAEMVQEHGYQSIISEYKGFCNL